MSDVLSTDNVFFRFMTKVCYTCYLSLLWLICSLPIVTIGAATTALNTVMLRVVRNEEGYITKSFFKAFKTSFKRATALWLIVLGGCLIFGGDIIYFNRMDSWLGTISTVPFIAMLFVMGLILMLLFHHLAWFDKSVKETLKQSFFMSLGYLQYSVALLVFFIAMGYGIYTSVPLMIIFTLFGAGLFAYISAYLWRRVFDKVNGGT